jgi:HK97 family phage prohead protease
MTKSKETRLVKEPVQIRTSSDGKGKTIVGYASVFAPAKSSNLGGFIEQVDPKAFDDTLNGDARAYFNHDPNFVLGRQKSGTLRLSTDKKGLRYEVDVPDTQLGRDLVVSMQRGDIDSSSFGFICDADEWEDNDSGPALRTLKKVRLIDVSPVTVPAYPDATSGVRTLPASMPIEIRSKIENRSDDVHTKKVDGEDLTADCFLIVGDPAKTDTWHLPWKFSTDEKTKSHLRDALARFDQVEGVSDDVKKAAYKKLVGLCKEHGIQVSDDKEENSMDITSDDNITPDDPNLDDDGDDTCECNCAQCQAGSCSICSNDDCDDEECACYNQMRSLMRMQLELAKATRF